MGPHVQMSNIRTGQLSPFGVQTAGEIVFSYWSKARQDFQLPLCAANQGLAAITDRENKGRWKYKPLSTAPELIHTDGE